MPIPLVKAETSQIGLAIEASVDNGETWITVKLYRYIDRGNGAIDPARDRAEYFATLDRNGVEYKRVEEFDCRL